MAFYCKENNIGVICCQIGMTVPNNQPSTQTGNPLCGRPISTRSPHRPKIPLGLIVLAWTQQTSLLPRSCISRSTSRYLRLIRGKIISVLGLPPRTWYHPHPLGFMKPRRFIYIYIYIYIYTYMRARTHTIHTHSYTFDRRSDHHRWRRLWNTSGC